MMNDRPALAHLGIFVSDVDAMERFYTEVFGLVVTDRGVGKVFRNTLVFLSGAADQIGRIARRFDLVIVGQPPRSDSLPAEVVGEGVLFESGRPVIFVPFIQKGGMKLDRIMVCWDGSRAASRAVADALPFLKKSKQVEIVIISDKPSKKDEVPGADLGQHLARHGLKVEVKRITAPDTDVPSTILSYAADSSADMIVMGGTGIRACGSSCSEAPHAGCSSR